MNFRLIPFRSIAFGLLTLGLNDGYSAEDASALFNRTYKAFKSADADKSVSVAKLNEGLQCCNQYKFWEQPYIIGSISAQVYLSKSVIKLSSDDLQDVVGANHEFFKSGLGVSLLYGWALNHYQRVDTPYYVGNFFSFNNHFQGLVQHLLAHHTIDLITGSFLSSRFTLGLREIDASQQRRFDFFSHTLLINLAIESVRAEESAKPSPVASSSRSASPIKGSSSRPASPVKGLTPKNVKVSSIPWSVRSSFRSTKHQIAESNAPKGAARHLWVDITEEDSKNSWQMLNLAPEKVPNDKRGEHHQNKLIGLQKFLLKKQVFSQNVDQNTKEIILSLPHYTPSNYNFLSNNVNGHINRAKEAIQLSLDRDHLQNSTGWVAASKDVLARRKNRPDGSFKLFSIRSVIDPILDELLLHAEESPLTEDQQKKLEQVKQAIIHHD